MKSFTPKSAVMQLTDHLREEILSGEIRDTMPGVNQLVRELGAGTQTVIAAIAALEQEGLLENLGGRSGRKIVRAKSGAARRGLKVQILLYEKGEANEAVLVDLQYRLQTAGHLASFSSTSLLDLGMDPVRVARFVKSRRADAWVVFIGSRPVLEWFASQTIPSFALLGRGSNLDLAGLTVSKAPAMSHLLRDLVKLGHRRIVLMSREERRKPTPGILEQHYLAELNALGIPTGPYNLPDWDNNPQSFYACLDSLFAHTPPTAIIFDVPLLYFSAQQFFIRHRIRVPDDVSIAVLEGLSEFTWSIPAVTHIDVDSRQWTQKVMRWIHNVALGKDDRRKTVVKAKIVEGGTIAKAP